jgi:hypothetical protein
MPINPTDPSKSGSPPLGSFWAATAGTEVENYDPVSAFQDERL